MKRFFINHERWEDYKANLYETKNQNYIFLEKSISLLKDTKKLKSAMQKVTNQWPLASKVHLSNASRNRNAWLGQASCCLNHGANETTTKQAWNGLNSIEQDNANEVAAKIIAKWEKKYAKKLS